MRAQISEERRRFWFYKRKQLWRQVGCHIPTFVLAVAVAEGFRGMSRGSGRRRRHVECQHAPLRLQMVRILCLHGWRTNAAVMAARRSITISKYVQANACQPLKERQLAQLKVKLGESAAFSHLEGSHAESAFSGCHFHVYIQRPFPWNSLPSESAGPSLACLQQMTMSSRLVTLLSDEGGL